MKNIKINKKNLNIFLNNIRKEDLEELIFSYGKNYRNVFIETSLKYKNSSWFVADENEIPIAIGGYCPLKKDKQCALIWLLCTKNIKNNEFALFKYVVQKINYLKANFHTLFNCIYKSNFKSLKWLEKQNFIVSNLKDKNYKLFYFRKEKK